MKPKFAIAVQHVNFPSMKVDMDDDDSGTIIFCFTEHTVFLWDSKDGAEELLEAERAKLVEQWGAMELRIVEVSFR